jgi:hypothetical protein
MRTSLDYKTAALGTLLMPFKDTSEQASFQTRSSYHKSTEIGMLAGPCLPRSENVPELPFSKELSVFSRAFSSLVSCPRVQSQGAFVGNAGCP